MDKSHSTIKEIINSGDLEAINIHDQLEKLFQHKNKLFNDFVGKLKDSIKENYDDIISQGLLSLIICYKNLKYFIQFPVDGIYCEFYLIEDQEEGNDTYTCYDFDDFLNKLECSSRSLQ
jgi:hypothetical protein